MNPSKAETGPQIQFTDLSRKQRRALIQSVAHTGHKKSSNSARRMVPRRPYGVWSEEGDTRRFIPMPGLNRGTP
jgi:hypothetical protein